MQKPTCGAGKRGRIGMLLKAFAVFKSQRLSLCIWLNHLYPRASPAWRYRGIMVTASGLGFTKTLRQGN